jgi:hypothetical protein
MKRFLPNNFRRLVTLVLLGCLITATAGFKACPKSEKDRNVAYARDVLSGFQAGQRFIDQVKPSLSDEWREATNSSSRLIEAVAASDQEEVVALLADIMPVFTEGIDALTNNTTALSLLSWADIALHIFANHIGAAAVALASPARATTKGMTKSASAATALVAIERFRAQPSFGCRYAPEKCR